MELSEIRSRIDDVDNQLLSLFLERMALSEDVAAYKEAHSLPLVNKTREREILAEMTAKAGDKERYVHNLFSTLFELSRSRQAELISAPTQVHDVVTQALSRSQQVFPKTGLIACQGIEGGNSQAAADHLFPRGNLMFVNSFPAVVAAVESGLCRFGVLPIENSANGSVRAVYELLQNHRLSVVRSTRLCIRHELLAKPGTRLENVTTIYSHEQALGQCAQFLEAHKGIQVVPCANTAVAARQVAESGDPHAAAIASHSCVALYGLTCLDDHIQDSDNNYTRFICVTKNPEIYDGSDRISLIFSCENRPGALYSMLAKLDALGINMTKLESCPVTGRAFEFVFFLELEANLREPGVLAMLEEMERCSETFQLLGSYSEV